MRLGNILLIENFLNNDTTNEEATAGGNALARHITKTVQLADGQDAEDLIVILDAYKPQGTDVHVYYKILHADDGDTMRDVPYVKMTQDTEANLYSSSENQEDFKEYEFSIPTSKQTGHNDTVEYLNTQGVTFAGFKNFKVKIVFTGTNTTLPPRVRDLRVIALQR
jgi:type VI protein secretion system component VasA